MYCHEQAGFFTHLLEPPLKGCVLLHVLAVLCQGRGADAAQLTSRQHGLQQIRSVHRAIRLTRPQHLQRDDTSQRAPFRVNAAPGCCILASADFDLMLLLTL